MYKTDRPGGGRGRHRPQKTDDHWGVAAPRLAEVPDDAPLIMIIRHAEKPLPSNRSRGITAGGRRDKRSLTVTGWQRAGALVELFAPSRGVPLEGLRRPDCIYCSAAERGGSRR